MISRKLVKGFLTPQITEKSSFLKILSGVLKIMKVEK